jgi:hypothetical protein
MHSLQTRSGPRGASPSGVGFRVLGFRVLGPFFSTLAYVLVVFPSQPFLFANTGPCRAPSHHVSDSARLRARVRSAYASSTAAVTLEYGSSRVQFENRTEIPEHVFRLAAFSSSRRNTQKKQPPIRFSAASQPAKKSRQQQPASRPAARRRRRRRLSAHLGCSWSPRSSSSSSPRCALTPSPPRPARRRLSAPISPARSPPTARGGREDSPTQSSRLPRFSAVSRACSPVCSC